MMKKRKAAAYSDHLKEDKNTMHIPIIDEKRRKYRVERIRHGEPNIQDKATEIEDDDTGEKQLKLKSDGTIVPKPGADKISTTKTDSLLAKLKGDKYRKQIKLIDYGDGSGDFVDVDVDEGKVKASGDERMFETHRNLMQKKISRLFEEEDNTQVWLAAYLTVLALLTVGAMFFVTQGIEDTVAQAVQQGIEAGLNSANTAQEGATGATGG